MLTVVPRDIESMAAIILQQQQQQQQLTMHMCLLLRCRPGDK
jgi:hypothetical protein